MVEVRVLLAKGARLPVYASEQAAGADLFAHLLDPIVIIPGQTVVVPTGIQLEIPRGYEMQIRPRSGLAFKEGITVLNAPGTIDADYRGEIQVMLIHHGKKNFVILDGMRIAQMVLAPVSRSEFISCNALQPTVRGEGKFGHTGLMEEIISFEK